ncbi:Short-chain dehydrogenase/reductase family 16C member 6 [Colletotrichum tanaceti]|uniref:Short-chain dehydrogenase/reductase family 16C member 6 n=1 Tax=Colletotrichum tanaceti TaxID=1306861 RepID=A0A4U6X2L5_9PEZI|nr:Short-chain dehydrogenase/reductase family 16C member 6 [Colletotrichum tanaceti]TKW49602.1 Short-chain dehydrogenase/reductase family 16C member 6 [Colletotrichum tanaceti]
MILSREGFTIDVVARWLRNSILNPYLSIPFAIGLAAVSVGKNGAGGGGGLSDHLRLHLHLNSDTPHRVAFLAALASLVLSATAYLNKWSANNWTTDDTWDFDKEVVVVTGGSSGIGNSIVRHILSRTPRATVVVVDLAPLSWEGTADNVRYYRCDLTDTGALKALCDRIRAEVGHPTVLVNNAGIARGTTVMNGSYADVELTVKTNLVAPFLLTKEFLPHMVRTNHGHIVNVGSMSSVVPPPKIADYSATKAGLTAMHEALQLELKYIHKAPKVRQTLGIFGFIRTPLVPFNPGQPHFMMPLLHVDSVAEAIVDSLYSGFGRTIYLPGIMSPVTALRAGPEWLWRLARETTAGAKDITYTPRQKINEATGRLEVAEVVSAKEKDSA